MKNKAGFTLTELVLVILLIGIVGASADAMWNNNNNIGLAASKMRTDIRKAQQLAMTSGTNHGLLLTPGGRYSIYKESTTSVISHPLTLQPYTEDIPVSFPGTTVSTIIYQVEFDSTGKPVIGGGGTVTLRFGSTLATVRITDDTGFVP